MLANNAIRRDRIETDLDQSNRLFPISAFRNCLLFLAKNRKYANGVKEDEGSSADLHSQSSGIAMLSY